LLHLCATGFASAFSGRSSNHVEALWVISPVSALAEPNESPFAAQKYRYFRGAKGDYEGIPSFNSCWELTVENAWGTMGNPSFDLALTVVTSLTWGFFMLTFVKMSLLTIVLLCLSLVMPAESADGTRTPNIVVIMADDLGYGDVSCYGAERLKTPHIDQLAAEGLRFTSGYCSASTCTPTRFSFLTGTYAFRQKGTGIAAPNNPAIIKPGTETLPSLLKRAGYKTAVIGKWHLGLGGDNGPDWNGQLNPGPLEIGFDYCYLLPTTNDRVPQVYVENHQVKNLDPNDPLWVGNEKPNPDHPTGITHRDTLKMDWSRGHNGTIHNGISRIGFYTGGHAARFRDEDLADEWVKQSNKWMEDNKDQPFFLFFASHDLHVPRMPHERFQGKTPLGYRGDAIAQLDWCVGELMKTLKRLNLEKNTLVVFCSDNGPVLDDGYKDGAVEKLATTSPPVLIAEASTRCRKAGRERRSSPAGWEPFRPACPKKWCARSIWPPVSPQ
jgi:arylsulfatase A-like enzyme